jgi:hypothetical protein
VRSHDEASDGLVERLQRLRLMGDGDAIAELEGTRKL